MSFTELMQSGRGPGVIGMLMALVVLIGFGLLFMFAFDEGAQGGAQTIEGLIRNQEKEIEGYRLRIQEGDKMLAGIPALVAAAKDVTRIKRQNVALAEKVVVLKKQIETANADLAAGTKSFEDYKDEYRAFIRSKAKGQTLPQLETKSGAVYKNVFIREVSAVGIQVRHDEGQKRIPYEDLPDAMVDLYQFDPAQKAAALADEHVTRSQHEAAADVANDQAEQAMAAQREKDAQASREKTLREISLKEGQISALQEEIKGLENDMSRAASDAASARAAGHIHINNSGNIAGNIRSKQNRISALRSEISRMSASAQ